MLRRRLITLAMLLVAGATALVAVPGLRDAARRASSIQPLWLIGAVALELASCVSFLAIFRRFFDELPAPVARRLAWIEMGSGALLPGGGVGSLAAGALLLRRSGMPTRRIVEKSSGLFFLTSGTNVLALEGGALLLALGLGSGPRGLLPTALPALTGLLGVAGVAAIPRTRWYRSGRSRALSSVVDGITEAEHELLHAHWRLLGALGYLGFDIAVLGLTCAGVGHPIGIPALVLAYIIGYAANAVPVPGGFGVLEGGLVGALFLYGAPVVPATAAVLIYHTIAFWIPSLGGAIAYSIITMTGQTRPQPPAAPRDCEGRVRSPQLVPTRAEAA
ncbi:MAG: flippase-like domain-containing protein [Actinomycetota bacterium]|nr:flippase-like domain-containing protein [Actinomycetota bacterium]